MKESVESCLDASAFIRPPSKIPFYIQLGILISKKVTKKDLLAPKLLAWYPKVAISSGLLESMIAHGKKDLTPRVLKLVRIQTSICVACPFCVDMNSFEFEKEGITLEEMHGLDGHIELEQISTLTTKERMAIEYSKLISQTPVIIPTEFMNNLKQIYTEREIVILSSTAAQVNYWARMMVALGVPPAGFSQSCNIPSNR